MRRCRRSRQSHAEARPSRRLHRFEYRVGRLVTAGPMNTEPDPHADLHRLRCNTLDAAHQPETLIAVNECGIVRRAFAWMGDRRGIDPRNTRAPPPFETVAGRK